MHKQLEILDRADKLVPLLPQLLPYIDELAPHVGWLLEFADVEGFEHYVPLLDSLVPHLHKLEPHLGGHFDAIVFWLTPLLPAVEPVLGMLKSRRVGQVVELGAPLVRYLPSVPPPREAIRQALVKKFSVGSGLVKRAASGMRMRGASRHSKSSRTPQDEDADGDDEVDHDDVMSQATSVSGASSAAAAAIS